jgi:hypothetical protein
MTFFVYSRDNGGSTGSVTKRTPGWQTVEGIGCVGGRSNDLAQRKIDFGAS